MGWQATYMSHEVTSQSKLGATNIANKRSLLKMHGLIMLDHIAMQREADMASLALMLALSVVALHVAVQI